MAGNFPFTSIVYLYPTYTTKSNMTPSFTVILICAIVFAIPILSYLWWRFGGPDMLSFMILSGGFTAIMDFISSFVVRNYEYPGQTHLWVFTFIFFGWIGMCGSCLFIAEGIIARPNHDMITQRKLWWQVPLLTAVIAVVLDLFIDPVAVSAGYWIWFVKGTVFFEIPLLNYVGWFVLMFLAPLGWILIARYRHWGYFRKTMASLVMLLPLCLASIIFSVILNGTVAAIGLK